MTNAPKKTLKELHAQAQLPAAQAGGQLVDQYFKANRQAMAAVLPQHVTAERMTRIALFALRANPKLMECTTTSLMGAVLQCSQLGLEPNTMMGHAYLIPYRNKQQKRTDVQIQMGYRGMLDLARRSGQIISISAHEVCENDEFDYAYGLEDTLVHKPARKARGLVTDFYAVAKLKDGGHVFEVMSNDEIRQVMLSSQSRGEYGPWKDHYTAMGRKTVIRRIFKYLPVSIEMAQAVAMDEVADARGNQHLETALDGDYQIVPDDYEDTEKEPDLKHDSDGVVWDPRFHATGADGNPILNQDGTFRAKRGAKKALEHADEEKTQSEPDAGTTGEEDATTLPNQAVPPTLAELTDQLQAVETQDDIDDLLFLGRALPDSAQAILKDAAAAANERISAD